MQNLRDELGCRLARDQGGGDDDVDVFALPREQRHFGGDEFRRHLLRVAAGALPRLLQRPAVSVYYQPFSDNRDKVGQR